MGTTEAQTLAAIQRRFAGREDVVVRRFKESQSFRDLCRDYVVCAAVLARWQESESEAAPARSAEYAELLAELTTELQARLGPMDG